mgnify:CR=1 FL=1
MPSLRDHGHHSAPVNKSARLLGWVGLLGLGVASLQCTKDSLSLPSQLGPANIDMIDGDGQTGVVGDALADSLIVRVTNSDKNAVQGYAGGFQARGALVLAPT